MPKATLASLVSTDTFQAAVGGCYEKSPWVAERAFAAGPFDSITALAAALQATVDAASDEEKLALLRADPHLTGAELQGALQAQNRELNVALEAQDKAEHALEAAKGEVAATRAKIEAQAERLEERARKDAETLAISKERAAKLEARASREKEAAKQREIQVLVKKQKLQAEVESKQRELKGVTEAEQAQEETEKTEKAGAAEAVDTAELRRFDGRLESRSSTRRCSSSLSVISCCAFLTQPAKRRMTWPRVPTGPNSMRMAAKKRSENISERTMVRRMNTPNLKKKMICVNSMGMDARIVEMAPESTDMPVCAKASVVLPSRSVAELPMNESARWTV